jgi:hypothetical protein
MLGNTENIRQIRIVDYLNQALPIPQIDEYDPTVIASAVYPATEFYFLVDMRAVDLSTIVTAHGYFLVLNGLKGGNVTA